MRRMSIRRMRKKMKARGNEDSKDNYDRSDEDVGQGQGQ